ncbi:MAG TPA: prolipoprotein diacylglyceryl transferase [Bryobacteraceae bacterium]|nr:prolipoprotein diacylglyceryl transferase [Bryobacteraceae bacterium]
MFPKLIEIGSFYLPTYGVLVALAFLCAIWVTSRIAKGFGLEPEQVTNLAVYCALAGMAGAKLFMFLFDWEIYARNPGQIFSLSTLQAAGVYQGGLLLALLVAFLYMRRTKMPALLTADVFAPGLALGHFIGRLGCFSAGCCWGTECNRSWAVTFRNPEAAELTGVPLNVPLHPSQLYEAFAELLLFFILYWFIRRPHRTGSVIGLYLAAYSLIRFAVEFFRHHEQALPGGVLSLTQWISIGTLLLGLALLLSGRQRQLVHAT